jgi:heavy metal sensor kinase
VKSIRLSLIVYFLVLLALALGAVSAVVYQATAQSLLAKERTSRDRLQERHESRCRVEKAKLDDALRRRVEQLAKVVQSPRGRDPYYGLHLLGLLSSSTSPYRYVEGRLWWAEVYYPPLAWRLNRTYSLKIVPERTPLHRLAPLNLLSAVTSPNHLALAPLWTNEWRSASVYHDLGLWPVPVKLEFADNVLPGNNDGQETEYCQTVSDKGKVWQSSSSLGDDRLPLPGKAAQQLKASKMLFSDDRLRSGVSLRVVTFKSPVPRFMANFFNGPRPRGRNGGPRRRGGPAPVSPWIVVDRQTPTFFIQYAQDAARRDAALKGFQDELDKDVKNLQAETTNSLDTLRSQLLWIGLFTFAATVVGGFGLVSLGLSPLRRLSEALSRVSEKDIRLQLDRPNLPRELRPIVDRLNQTFQLLERAFAREKQAAADISHELRTPLAALLTTTEVALRKPRSPEEYRELLSDCRESGKQMSQLVERLLALARLDAGVDMLRPREVDATALAEQCAALVRPLAEARGVSLHVHQRGPAPLTADADKLREVMTNLLHNAIEYNRPSGAIDLRVERENGHLRVEVSDTGIGIPESAREHIFERFYRADPSRQADGLHAGLGLAIVKGYVDLMGGTIGVSSTEGQGSTFRVQLPVTPGSDSKATR